MNAFFSWLHVSVVSVVDGFIREKPFVAFKQLLVAYVLEKSNAATKRTPSETRLMVLGLALFGSRVKLALINSFSLFSMSGSKPRMMMFDNSGNTRLITRFRLTKTGELTP